MTLRINRIELADASKGVDVDYVVSGSAKAFGSFEQGYQANNMPPGYPTSGSVGDTLNISSFSDLAEGRLGVDFANPMISGKYAANCTTHIIGYSLGSSVYDQRYGDMSCVFDKTASNFDCGNSYVNGNARDGFYAGIVVHGDLA